MRLAKSIALLIAMNMAIMLVLGVVVNVLGLDTVWIKRTGIDPAALFLGSALFGFSGAFISLALSKVMAKWTTGAQVITQPRSDEEAWLVGTVHDLARRAGIQPPEVAIYDSPDMNAFATGPTRNRALVAVSTGLMRSMNRREVEAVLAHEVSHAANGDMVTMTLVQGVLNTFVIALSRVIGYVVDNALRGNRDEEEHSGPGIGYMITNIAAQIVLGILASIIAAWFSRRREYAADKGAADLVGPQPMMAALDRLRRDHDESHLPEAVKAFGIRSGPARGFSALFMSHPPLEERIERLATMSGTHHVAVAR